MKYVLEYTLDVWTYGVGEDCWGVVKTRNFKPQRAVIIERKTLATDIFEYDALRESRILKMRKVERNEKYVRQFKQRGEAKKLSRLEGQWSICSSCDSKIS